jgi:predicted nucleotidyltransferase
MHSLVLLHREQVLAIAHRYGLQNLRVFGSAARGTLTAESDVDLLAEFPEDFTLFRQSAAERELAEILGRKVDLVSVNGLRSRIREGIIREAVCL